MPHLRPEATPACHQHVLHCLRSPPSPGVPPLLPPYSPAQGASIAVRGVPRHHSCVYAMPPPVHAERSPVCQRLLSLPWRVLDRGGRRRSGFLAPGGRRGRAQRSDDAPPRSGRRDNSGKWAPLLNESHFYGPVNTSGIVCLVARSGRCLLFAEAGMPTVTSADGHPLEHGPLLLRDGMVAAGTEVTASPVMLEDLYLGLGNGSLVRVSLQTLASETIATLPAPRHPGHPARTGVARHHITARRSHPRPRRSLAEGIRSRIHRLFPRLVGSGSRGRLAVAACRGL